jgi:hypothetical protein
MPTTDHLPVNGHQAAEPTVLPAQPGTIFNARSIVHTLETLMNRVTEQEATPDTVTAACRCASEISQLLKIHLEAERLRREDEQRRRAEERLRGTR